MKKIKNDAIKMIVALTTVGIISGTGLVFVYSYAMPKITANISEEIKKAIKNIFPETAKTDEIGKQVFKVSDENDQILGYAFISEGNGYQGTIKLMAGVDMNFSEMKGMEVLESQETPGLGAEIANEKFKGQFKGLDITRIIEYVKNQKLRAPHQIEAITGATISSRAVVNMLNEKIEEIRAESNVNAG